MNHKIEKCDNGDVMYTATQRMLVQFTEQKEEYIKSQIIDHIIANGEEYQIINISKDRIRQIIELGIKELVRLETTKELLK